MESRPCPSCETTSDDNFCPACGERMIPKPINFSGLVSDFFSNFITLELPLFRTLKNMVTRPGDFIRDYVEGKRRNFYRPVQFYLLCLTLYYFFIFYVMGTDMFINEELQSGNAGISSEQLEKIQKVINIFIEYSRLTMAAQIPIHASLIWIFFRKHGHSYWVYVTLTLYSSGLLLLANCFLAPINLILPASLASLFGLIMSGGALAFNVWTYSQFHNSKTAATIFKGILIVLLNMVVFGAIVVIAIYALIGVGILNL